MWPTPWEKGLKDTLKNKINIFQFTFNPSWESSDTVQHISVNMILYTLYTVCQTIFMYNLVFTSVHRIYSWKSPSRDVQNVKFWSNAKWEYLIFVLSYREGPVQRIGIGDRSTSSWLNVVVTSQFGLQSEVFLMIRSVRHSQGSNPPTVQSAVMIASSDSVAR